jgi:hypothetical protein
VALVDGKPIAKASFYFASHRWLVTSLGSGIDVGGTHGHPGVCAFETLDQAKRAISRAWKRIK